MPNLANDADHIAFRRLAEAYVIAVDRSRIDLFDLIMIEDAVIRGPSFKVEGLAKIRQIPQALRDQFILTRHALHNQFAEYEGAGARGQLYCTADHLWKNASGGFEVTSWALHYDDEFVRRDGGWLFARRKVTIDWSETRPVEGIAGGTIPRLPRLDDPPRSHVARAGRLEDDA